MPEGSLWFFFIINHVQLQKMTEPKASPICLMLIMQTEWRWRCNGSVARFVLINAIIIIIKIMDTFQQSLRRNWIRLKNKYKYIIWEDGILLTRDQNVISASFFLSGFNGSTTTHLAVSLIFCRKETHRQRYWLCTKSIIPGECGKDYHFDRRIPLI